MTDDDFNRKRAFQRRGAYLTDRYEYMPGQHSEIYLPAGMLVDVAPNAASRRQAIAEYLDGAPFVESELFDLRGETSEEVLEALLEGLDAGRWRASHALLRFVDDARVRPALADAVRRAPADRLPQVAHPLGLAGGDEARDVLRERLEEILAMPQTFASALESVSAALLRLDADAGDAARALIQLFSHPCPINRRAAVQEAVEVFRRGMETAAMREIAAALDGFSNIDDDELFLRAAPFLFDKHRDAVLQRCEELLNREDYHLRALAFNAIIGIPQPYMAEAIALLVRWVPRGEPLDLTMSVVSTVRPFLPDTLVENLVRRTLASESPWLRYNAMMVADGLPERLSRPMLEQALTDEPDPALQKKLRAQIELMKKP